MSSIITNSSLIKKLANDLIKPHQLHYSEDCIYYYLDEEKFSLENIPNVRNNYQNLLKCSLIKHRPKKILKSRFKMNIEVQEENINSKCIIFCHGLGSSRLQAMQLLETLPKQYCLFAFDFSGNGKSQGENVTYGLRQTEDIQTVFDHLFHEKNLREFVLWGRSMGAVSCLLFAKKMREKFQKTEENISDKIKGIVLDSPFSSFEQITKHLAVKKFSIPSFLLDVGLHFLKETFEKILYDQEKKRSLNPFEIKFDEDFITDIPAVFLYSLTDDVVPKEHSEKIILHYKSKFEKIIMEDHHHNENRPKEILQRVFDSLKKFEKKHYKRNSSLKVTRSGLNFNTQMRQSRKNRGISVCTPSKQKQKTIESPKKQKNFYSCYGTMKVQPHRRKESRSPKRLTSKHKKEKGYSIFSELNTISYDQNDILKMRFEDKKNSKHTFKRRNNYMHNLQRKGDLDLILNHSKYL